MEDTNIKSHIELLEEIIKKPKSNGKLEIDRININAIGELIRSYRYIEAELKNVRDDLDNQFNARIKAERAEHIALELTKAWCGQEGCANHTKVMEVYKNYVGELVKYV